MKKISLVLLASASLVLTSGAATNFAARVVAYDPGLGYAAGFTNAPAALGEPSRLDPYASPIEPFNPPYGTNQIVSLGEGGSLTVKFARPVYNAPRQPFGLDFIIFGNSGFIITNDFNPVTYEWLGPPATDGSMFANNPGLTRVSVSADGVRFFLLDTNLAPVVDGLFPTEGSGNFAVPVNPALTADDLAGATQDDLRSVYRGSGGGTGYNINWARTRHGQRVHLPYIRFVRVEVLSGKAEIDGFSATARPVRRVK